MRFNCPRCSQTIEIDYAWAGRSVECPNCKTSIVVPTKTGAKLPQKSAMRRKGGGCLGKFILLLLIAAGAFAFWVFRFNESPQQAWQKLQRVFQQPEKPAPTPSPTPESTPTPTPEPTATPTPIPSATPTPVEPVSWLMEHKDRWPTEIALIKPVDFPAVINGKVVGSVKVPAGSRLNVIDLEPDAVIASFENGKQRIGIDATDLRQRAQVEAAKPTTEEASMPIAATSSTHEQPSSGEDAPEPEPTAPSDKPEPEKSPLADAFSGFSTTAGATSGHSVTLVQNDKGVVLSNGIVTAAISNASITSLKYKGQEMAGTVYYSMDGGANYRTPGGGDYFVKTKSPELVDIGFKHERKNEPQALDCEIHYVVKRGVSGVYTYAILTHPADYPKTGYGEWRAVWKLSNDLLENIYVDELRHWQMPSSEDYKHAQPTGIKEITKITTGVRAGQYDCKYDFSASYYDIGCWGHASDKHKLGGWIVVGGYDYFNDGPTKQDLNAASGINHIHFGMNHYNGSTLHVDEGEEWQKIYGPFLLYCNSSEKGGDAMWADAKKQVEIEKSEWPYEWLTDTSAYPPAKSRGSLTGHLIVKDTLKPKLSAADAWVGLAQPPAGGNWQFESKHYQYWAKADSSGNFTIPAVRPGTYTFYAYTNGAVGEYSKENVEVKAGINRLPNDVVWEVPHKGHSIAWEIGVPDRTAKEFHHGNDYFHGYVWTTFQNEFKNPLEYTVGKSDWSKDWNYAQSWYDTGNKHVPWKWRIHFDLKHLPASGNATMTFAIASAHGAVHINVYVNNENSPVTSFAPSVQGGNALLRESIHAKYCVEYVDIPVTHLKRGENIITLEQVRTDTQTHVMYDYLNLELP